MEIELYEKGNIITREELNQLVFPSYFELLLNISPSVASTVLDVYSGPLTRLLGASLESLPIGASPGVLYHVKQKAKTTERDTAVRTLILPLAHICRVQVSSSFLLQGHQIIFQS